MLTWYGCLDILLVIIHTAVILLKKYRSKRYTYQQILPYTFFLLLKGQPMPQVSWWRDSHLIDSSFEKTFGRTVQNTLSVPQVSREDLGAMLTCQASNNNISAPASSRVTIDLKCKYNNINNLQIVL